MRPIHGLPVMTFCSDVQLPLPPSHPPHLTPSSHGSSLHCMLTMKPGLLRRQSTERVSAPQPVVLSSYAAGKVINFVSLQISRQFHDILTVFEARSACLLLPSCWIVYGGQA